MVRLSGYLPVYLGWHVTHALDLLVHFQMRLGCLERGNLVRLCRHQFHVKEGLQVSALKLSWLQVPFPVVKSGQNMKYFFDRRNLKCVLLVFFSLKRYLCFLVVVWLYNLEKQVFICLQPLIKLDRFTAFALSVDSPKLDPVVEERFKYKNIPGSRGLFEDLTLSHDVRKEVILFLLRGLR
jgi:hypothetical protein